MVNRVVFSCVLAGLFVQAHGQQPPASDLERRVTELEEKMRLVDPAFGRETRAADLAGRLELLERKMAEVLASGPVQAAGPGLTPVAVAGNSQADNQGSTGETRLPVAGYMDFHLNKDAGESFRPDFHRFVLLFGHSFSERIKFWSELEVEHALVEGGEESGEVALEQAYLDFLIKPAFNLRAGMMLTPVGILNERHEPPAFNGVERTFVETTIIPTTWRELGFGFTGDLGRGFRYRAYLTSSLDASRFDAESGIGGGRTAGFDASFRNPAKVARLEYAGVRRLTLGTSVYSGHAGFRTPGVNPGVTIAEFDGRFSYRRLDLRGLFANTWVSQAGELNWRLQQTVRRQPERREPNARVLLRTRHTRAAARDAERRDPVRALREVQHAAPHAGRLHAAAAVQSILVGDRRDV